VAIRSRSAISFHSTSAHVARAVRCAAMNDDSARAASAGLLSAALGGLLAFSVSCGSSATTPNPIDTGTIADASHGDGADVAVSDSGAPSDSAPNDTAADSTSDETATDSSVGADTTAADVSDLDAAIFDGDAACDVTDARVITSTVSDPGMTLDDFAAMCAALGGFVEIHPECGGHVTCKGLSYDQLTGLLTSHTCAGLNSCQGFSCILP